MTVQLPFFRVHKEIALWRHQVKRGVLVNYTMHQVILPQRVSNAAREADKAVGIIPDGVYAAYVDSGGEVSPGNQAGSEGVGRIILWFPGCLFA